MEPQVLDNKAQPLDPKVQKEVDARVKQAFNFYVTLGEPLAKHLSIRKFNRFLRDCGLVERKSSWRESSILKKAEKISEMQASQYGRPPNPVNECSPQKLAETVENWQASMSVVEYS